MAKIEHPERYSWWLNELESLSVDTPEKYGLNNHKEASGSTEAVKQTLYEDYLQAYSESNRCSRNCCPNGFGTIRFNAMRGLQCYFVFFVLCHR
jgi:hypothetical protein